MPQFNLSSFPSQIFWSILFLGIIIIINYLFIVPKIYEIFQKRQQKIDYEQKLVQKYINDSEILTKKSTQLLNELAVELNFVQTQFEERLKKYISYKKEQLTDSVIEIEKNHLRKIEQFQRNLEKSEANFSKIFTKTIVDKISLGSKDFF